MLQMLFFTLWWADVVSDGSDIQVPVFRLKHSISRTVEWWATHTSFRSVVSSDQRLASSDRMVETGEDLCGQEGVIETAENSLELA